jgi:hypothetical protein
MFNLCDSLSMTFLTHLLHKSRNTCVRTLNELEGQWKVAHDGFFTVIARTWMAITGIKTYVVLSVNDSLFF